MYGLAFSLVSPQLLVIHCASDFKQKPKKNPKTPKTTTTKTSTKQNQPTNQTNKLIIWVLFNETE